MDNIKKNIIINVGRQIGSGGRIIAKMLADDFKCGFYDRELLTIAAKESGFCEKFFEQNDEQKGFFHSLFHILRQRLLARGTLQDAERYDTQIGRRGFVCLRGQMRRLCAQRLRECGEHLHHGINRRPHQRNPQAQGMPRG